MKQNYKIRVDEKELSPERIDSHKDFNKVLADYHNLTQPLYKKPLYKNPKAFGGLMLILSMAAVVYIAVQEEKVLNDAKLTGADSVATKTPVVRYAPDFAQPGHPDAIDLQKTQPGIRGEFTLPDAGKPVRLTLWRSADEMIASGTPSLNPHDKGITVEKMFSLYVEDQQPASVTWTQVRSAGEPLELYRWEPQAHQWVLLGEPTRQPIQVDAPASDNLGDDGFKAIEFGAGANSGNEVKANTAHEPRKSQEKLTWTMEVPGLYRLVKRMGDGKPQGVLSVRPVDAAGKDIQLQRMFLVHEDGNLRSMEWKDNAWSSATGSGRMAAYGLTPDGTLVYATELGGAAVKFTAWEGQPQSPDALLQKLFGASDDN